jgi:hypothetical protein
MIGNHTFQVFTDDQVHPVSPGDIVRFDFEVRTLRSGRRNQYFAVLSETLVVDAPAGLSDGIEGSVYILSNPAMPKLLKIGFTTGSVQDRASVLSGVTGVPAAFRVEWALAVSGNPAAVEARAHAILAPHRSGKEFFQCDLETAKAGCRTALAELYPDAAALIDAHLAEEAERAKARRARQEERQAERVAAEEAEKTERREMEATRERMAAQRQARAIVSFLLEGSTVPINHQPYGLLGSVFGQKTADTLEIQAMYDGGQWGTAGHWTLHLTECTAGKLAKSIRELSRSEDVFQVIAEANDRAPARKLIRFSVSNLYLDNPILTNERQTEPIMELWRIRDTLETAGLRELPREIVDQIG